jgi:hypothetical protein
MAYNEVVDGTLTIECDHCHAEYKFYADEGAPVAEPVKCFRELRAIGWIAHKPVGYAWEQYCPACAILPEAERVPTSRD